MKKNFFWSMLAMSGMLFATSCSQDELATESAEEFVSATFNIGTTDGIGSRADIGKGTMVDKVACAVYDSYGTELEALSNIVPFERGTATYSVRLAKGQNYRIAFFAYNEAANAYDVDDLRNIKVNPDQDSNIEARDAFTAYYDVVTGKTMNSINETVTLYRPFAQLNLGVEQTEWDNAVNAGVKITKSKIVVSDVYSAFNAYEDKVVPNSNVPKMVFEMNDIPNEPLEVTIDGQEKTYVYLALNYLLVGDKNSDKSLTDVEFIWEADGNKKNDPTTKFLNIPVQRNYRTNIIGKLLTNPATFNIIIDEKFIDSPKNDYIVSVWDGESVETPDVDAENVCRISTAAELVGMMNDPNCNKYKNVVLECDIDLAGNTISGFGDASGFFNGVFDGQGHSISNFNIDATDRTYYAGLFNQVAQYAPVENTVIKNLIVKNATVAGSGQVGVIVGGMNGKTTVENCKVYNSTVKAVKKVGSVVGYTAGGTVKDNYAENCVIEYSEKEASEILGFENTGSTVRGNTFMDITFKASAAALAKEMTPDANGVITLTRDYTVVGEWTSQKYSGTITINGNGHTIYNLNKPLLAGNAASQLSIKGLTISESNIGTAANENELGTGAFICFQDASGIASFEDCHLLKSTVIGNERAGGLIAYSSGSKVSINKCSVIDCEIKAVGGAAGFVAYNQAEVEITDSKVEETTVEATEDRTGKRALAGAVIGTLNGNTTFTNVTVNNNTVKNTGADAESDKVGRILKTLTEN